jgi:hypothetical protein
METKKDQKQEQSPLEKQLEEVQKQLATLTAQKSEQDRAAQEQARQKEALAAQEANDQLEANSDLKALLENVTTEEDDPQAKARNVENLTNAQMLEAIAQATDTSMSARMEQQENKMAKQMKETNETIKGLQKVLLGFLAKSRLEEVQSQHPDFQQFGPAIQEVLKRYPTMDIKDAYTLAKGSVAQDVPPVNVAATEFPGVPMGPMQFPDRTGRQVNVAGESTMPQTMDMSPKREPGNAASRVADFRMNVASAVENVISQSKAVRR